MRMKYYIQSVDYQCWERIESGDYTTTSDRDQWTSADKAEFHKNALTITILYCGLSRSEFNRISMYSTAKEIWDKLEVTYEGTFRVKELKINLLVTQYEVFKMDESETIIQMYSRFTNIINSLKALGKIYTQSELIQKILRSLPATWIHKVSATEESKDLDKYELEELIGSLMTHEIHIQNLQARMTSRRRTFL